MTKRQMIDEIMTMNRSANPGFLAQFNDMELEEYLHSLVAVHGPAAPAADVAAAGKTAGLAHRAEAHTQTLAPPAPRSDRWLC